MTYKGKTFTFYEATQKQRSIERNIRKVKREKEALEMAGLGNEEQRMRLRELQAEAKSFSEATGVTRRRANEQIVKMVE